MKPRIKIKVIGVGGSGSNAVSRMMRKKLFGVDLIAINTDVQDLTKKGAHFKIRIGKKLTQGLGAGMNPETGRMAAEEQKEEIAEILKDSDMVFITTGLGGGTGSGASPVIADIAQSLKILTVAIVTLPFFFEGKARKEVAEEALRNFREKVDSLIVIPNDNLLKFLEPNTPLEKAFELGDSILYEAVRSVSDLILLPGIINVNFADIKSILEHSGSAFFGLGVAKGGNRGVEAVKKALHCPLLDLPLNRAKGVLFSVSGHDISLFEIDEVAKLITKSLNPQAKIIFGAIQDEELNKGEMKVAVILTGF